MPKKKATNAARHRARKSLRTPAAVALALMLLCTAACASGRPRTIPAGDRRPWAVPAMKDTLFDNAGSPPPVVPSFPQPSWFGRQVIRGYQKFIGPYYGSQCPYHPSCSNFGMQSVDNYGLLWGTLMAADRLSRCNLCLSKDPNLIERYPVIVRPDGTGRAALSDPPAANFIFASANPAAPSGDARTEAPPQAPPPGAVFSMDCAERLKAATDDQKRLFGFAVSLGQEKDCYRAITEFKRFMSYYPDSPLCDDCRLMIGACYLAGLKWQPAKEAFDALAAKGGTEEMRAAGAYMSAYCLLSMGDAPGCVDAAKVLHDASPEAKWKAEAMYLRFVAEVQDGRYPSAAETLDRLKKDFPGSVYSRLSLKSEDVLGGFSLPQKSQTAAGVLSAVVPGSGQCYAGNWGDGLMSFLWVGLLGYGTYESAEHDIEAVSVICGTIAIIFYSANIYGGINAADRYNERQSESFHKGIRGRSKTPNLFWRVKAAEDSGGFIGIEWKF
jgi:putative membrane protein insertion efficiency factor